MTPAKKFGAVLVGVGGLTTIIALFARRASAKESSCVPPVVGQRWLICAPNGKNQIATVSQGDFDALYDRVTRQFLAVVDNSTYGEEGRDGSAIVVPLDRAPWAQNTLTS